jgi:hypothetical protein
MPDLSNGVTVFRPPAELRRSCDEPCILFFDEANRAQEEVLQAVFQVCLDRVLPDGTPLHPDTRVYSAINAKARYSINRLDPALLDRFFVVDLNPDAPSWLSYGMRTGIASVILDFIRGKPDALVPVENGEVDSVQPTPRSWHFLSDALKSSGLVDDPKNLEKIRLKECDVLKSRINKIIEAGANVILTRMGIDDTASQYMIGAGVLGLRRIEKGDLQRIAKLTGATLVTTMATPEGEEVFEPRFLGECDLVAERAVGDNDFVFFEGCKNANACTIVLRGANEYFLDEVER